MYPALLVMYNTQVSVFDRTLGDIGRDRADRANIYNDAEEFVQEAIDYFRKVFIEHSNLPLSISLDILKHLKNVKIVIGLTEKTLKMKDLEYFYENLKLTGEEEYLESVFEIESHHRKLQNELQGSSRRKIDIMVNFHGKAFGLKYWIEDDNILCELLVFYAYF
jgi:hypothetical protein